MPRLLPNNRDFARTHCVAGLEPMKEQKHSHRVVMSATRPHKSSREPVMLSHGATRAIIMNGKYRGKPEKDMASEALTRALKAIG